MQRLTWPSAALHVSVLNVQVWLVSEQKQVPITDLWDEKDRAFLVFARSMGPHVSAFSILELNYSTLIECRGAAGLLDMCWHAACRLQFLPGAGPGPAAASAAQAAGCRHQAVPGEMGI